MSEHPMTAMARRLKEKWAVWLYQQQRRIEQKCKNHGLNGGRDD